MRFKTIAFALIVSSAVFILGCNPAKVSRTIGEELSFEVTVNPPLDSHTVKIIAGPCNGATGDLFTPATKFTTNKYVVPKGSSHPVFISCMHANIPLAKSLAKCTNVRVKAMLNGIVFDDRTFNLGFQIDDGSGTQNPCADGSQQMYRVITP
jgi:hypothetical protein